MMTEYPSLEEQRAIVEQRQESARQIVLASKLLDTLTRIARLRETIETKERTQ